MKIVVFTELAYRKSNSVNSLKKRLTGFIAGINLFNFEQASTGKEPSYVLKPRIVYAGNDQKTA
ncbi:hypothetical protein [Aquiflexum lacus]|uniref:hypothetical protein n=1 Tax=Aquiflexum lacus TaxID=2483805 RepID=UPI001892ED40|nr:hypothetical protein [Aquiflexum lacus]